MTAQTEHKQVIQGQTVWCRTAFGTWWKTTAAGGPGHSQSRPSWPVIPVYWNLADSGRWVNWPAEDVSLTDPTVEPATNPVVGSADAAGPDGPQ